MTGTSRRRAAAASLRSLARRGMPTVAVVAMVAALLGGVGSAVALVSSTPLNTDSPDHPVGPNGRVNAMVVTGDIVYIGGDFNSVGGETRHNLAAVNLNSGKVTDWNPNANGIVRALAVSSNGSLVYAGGNFSTIGGETRRKLAAIRTSNGNPTSWHPIPSAKVNTIDVHGSTVYIGGSFLTVGGRDVPYAAAISASTGLADASWDPRPDDSVRALDVAPDGGTVFLAGPFAEIDGVARDNVAAVDRASGTVTGWSVELDQIVLDLEVSADSSRVYLAIAGGGGAGGNRAAAYSASTGASLWSHQTDGDVQAVTVSADTAYFGGHFDLIGGIPFSKLVSYNAISGVRNDSWAPETNSVSGVWSLAYADGRLFVGGDFSRFGAVEQPHFAVFLEAGSGNQAPGAEFTWHCDWLACSFDATSSGDTDGTITSYAWTFGDGSSGSGVNRNHTYGSPDTYTVRLTVTDDDGATDTISHSVTVKAPPVHVHDLAPKPTNVSATRWRAVVSISVRNADHDPVVGAVVDGFFGQGKERSCTTGKNGKCKVKVKVLDTKAKIPWTVTDVTADGKYKPGANRDAVKGDSDGTVIKVKQP